MEHHLNRATQQPPFVLPARQPRRLPGAGPQRLECLIGTVWLSVDGLDVVLQPGESYPLRDVADAVIEALQKDALIKLTLHQWERSVIAG